MSIGDRLTYANVMSTIAVFGVLAGGGAYAASKIGAGDIKKNAVRSKHIKNGTIVGKDIQRKTRASLRGAQGPVGPKGDKGDPGSSFAGDCNEGLAPGDVMVRVGSVCVDRYEASIWTERLGGTQITGPIPCHANGQDCVGKIFARSVAGVLPRTNITWFQAQQALANSGKRLPSNADWQAAAAGTPEAGACNSGPGGVVEATGANPGCVSSWGVFDMVGNLTEWVADWVPRSTITCPGWGPFSDDGMCLSGAPDTGGGPGALVRGGDYQFSTAATAGVFDVYGAHPPYNSQPVIGFRGAR